MKMMMCRKYIITGMSQMRMNNRPVNVVFIRVREILAVR